jgi:hypothetical protein
MGAEEEEGQGVMSVVGKSEPQGKVCHTKHILNSRLPLMIPASGDI